MSTCIEPYCGNPAGNRRLCRACYQHRHRHQIALPDWEPAAPPPPGPWITDAACKGAPTDLWFTERGDNHGHAAAKAVCASCPVQEPCLQYALDNNIKHGTWGNTSERERRLLRKRMREQVA